MFADKLTNYLVGKENKERKEGRNKGRTSRQWESTHV